MPRVKVTTALSFSDYCRSNRWAMNACTKEHYKYYVDRVKRGVEYAGAL